MAFFGIVSFNSIGGYAKTEMKEMLFSTVHYKLRTQIKLSQQTFNNENLYPEVRMKRISKVSRMMAFSLLTSNIAYAQMNINAKTTKS